MANIFCVEDDTGIRELITCALQSGGYTAEGFPDGKSFFHRLRDDKPALILLDIMLPDEDGISILKRLKGNDATAEIPVIMLSAKSSEIDKVTGLENGADDYITKPFGIMELLSRIKAVLRRSHTVHHAAVFAGAGRHLDAELLHRVDGQIHIGMALVGGQDLDAALRVHQRRGKQQAADELAGHIAGQGEPAGAQAAKNRDALGRLLKV